MFDFFPYRITEPNACLVYRPNEQWVNQIFLNNLPEKALERHLPQMKKCITLVDHCLMVDAE